MVICPSSAALTKDRERRTVAAEQVLLPREHGLLELIDPCGICPTTLDAHPTELQQHSAGGRMDEVVAKR